LRFNIAGSLANNHKIGGGRFREGQALALFFMFFREISRRVMGHFALVNTVVELAPAIGFPTTFIRGNFSDG